MKIASWNINSLRKRQERLLDWLAKEQHDVVCLQETKCSDDQFPELALSAAGYRCVFHGQKSYNGVAILSRHELRDREAALCAESDDPQARVIAATINSPSSHSQLQVIAAFFTARSLTTASQFFPGTCYANARPHCAMTARIRRLA